jgi:hypothetical protein
LQPLADDEIMSILLLGTAGRRRRLGGVPASEPPRCPSLGAARHIFLQRKLRGRKYEYADLMRLLQQGAARVRGGELSHDLSRMMHESERGWRRETEDEIARLKEGAPWLARIQDVYRQQHLHSVAATMTLSEFKRAREGRAPLVFVVVAPEHRGAFFGTGKNRMRAIGTTLGIVLEHEAV